MINAPMHHTMLPQHTTAPIDYNTAGYVYLTGSEGIPARNGQVCGVAECTPYFINRETNELTELLKNNGESQTHTVHNIATDSVPANTYINALRTFDRVVALKEFSAAAAGAMIAFYVPEDYNPPTATYWYVSITATSNPVGPEDDPPMPGEGENTILYKGRSYDSYSNGAAYHTYVWIIQSCNSIDMAAWLESTGPQLIDDWVADIYQGDDGNKEWIRNATTATNSLRDTHMTVIDTELTQPTDYIESDIIALLDADDCDPDELCANSESPSLNVIGRSIKVDIIARTCGVNPVPQESNDQVTVYDTIGSFLYGRRLQDAKGRYGIAAYMQSDGEYDCHWMITWLDWFDPLQVVHDVIIGENGITIERYKVDVWRKCKLPVEFVEGETCEGDYYINPSGAT